MVDLGHLAPLWLLVALLAAAVAVAIVTRRSAVPATVGLVLLGLAVSILGPDVELPIDPELLLALVLPGLVFEAAFRTDLSVVRRSAGGVFLLAIPGVVIVAAIVAVVLSATTALSFTEAFLVGSMVAATDPAAVLAIFRRMRVPPRLVTIVEMESLVNDGTGIALFGLALEMLTGGGGSLGGSALAFAVSVAGAVVLGIGLGLLAARIIRHIDEHLTELTLTVVLAYGTYLAADALGLSGVIATLFAAGTFGTRARAGLTQRTIETIDDVWEFVAFLLTAAVFLLVGLAITPATLVLAAGPIVWGVVAILVARAVVVYGLLGGVSVLAARAGHATAGVPMSWLHVVFWAGLRGAVSVALALSLPADLPQRDLIQGITFGIVLFTLVVQGTTARSVVERTRAGQTADPPGEVGPAAPSA